MKEKIAEIIKIHLTEFNNNDFIGTITEVYLQCGAKGVATLKEMMEVSEIDMKSYNKAVEKIIKDLLKSSDLLDMI